MTISRITELHKQIDLSVSTIRPPFGYAEVTSKLVELCNLISNYEGDTEDWCYIGEYGYITLSDLIIGSYWHFTTWHGGQNSDSYAALCALGSIYSPGMACGPEDDSSELDCYNSLHTLASNFKG